MPGYKRVLLKLSGEALAGDQKFGVVPDAIKHFCDEIIKLHDIGTEIAVVIGGGNIFRGIKSSERGIDRVTADYMGMLGTVINALAIQDALGQRNVTARLISSIPITELSEPFIRPKAMRYLGNGEIVLFAGGTGNPYFSTDTAASLRAAQVNAEVILKGTKVNGVYDSDPVENPNAKMYDVISFDDVLTLGLKVMDATAIAMCRENNIPIIVCNLTQDNALVRIVKGERIGTLIKEDGNG